MADRFENDIRLGRTGAEAGVLVDEGLRAYMLRVYNYMASGVLLTGIVALLTYSTPALFNLFYTADAQGYMKPTLLGLIAMFAPLGLVLWLSFGIRKMQASTAQAVFWIYAAAMGLSLSSVMLIYTGQSVARTFFITAAAFGSLSLWGYTTKKDLSGWGSFLFMGLVGLMLASIVNMFFPTGPMGFIIPAVGVLLFAGLTAYDTQQIKWMYRESYGSESVTKLAILGALRLYLDFINMFLYLLRFLGDRR